MKTPDNWHPNLTGDYILGRVASLDDGTLRISFWGDDDYGMQLDLCAGNWDMGTKRRWEKWLKSLETISIKQLTAMGFENV